jgi:hypothetical protein
MGVRDIIYTILNYGNNKSLGCVLPQEKGLICGFKKFKGARRCQKQLCMAYCFYRGIPHKGKEIM